MAIALTNRGPCSMRKDSLMARIGRGVLSRPVGILAGSITLLIFLGCMSLSIGCRTEPDSTTCQEGKVSLRKGQELDVYYPIPYASPPNLEINWDADECEIIEQKADHFRIRCKRQCEATPHWKARGLKCPPPGTTPTVIVAPPAPPPSTNSPPSPLPPPTPIQNP